MGRLTTHVLDAAAGTPAQGLKIELYILDGGPVLLKTVHTNADGRINAYCGRRDRLDVRDFTFAGPHGNPFEGKRISAGSPKFLPVCDIVQ